MAVRPFYLDANIEGRQTNCSGGPRRKDGNMFINITQRNEGNIETAIKIECSSFEEDGNLMLESHVYDDKGELVYSKVTKY